MLREPEISKFRFHRMSLMQFNGIMFVWIIYPDTLLFIFLIRLALIKTFQSNEKKAHWRVISQVFVQQILGDRIPHLLARDNASLFFRMMTPNKM